MLATSMFFAGQNSMKGKIDAFQKKITSLQANEINGLSASETTILKSVLATLRKTRTVNNSNGGFDFLNDGIESGMRLDSLQHLNRLKIRTRNPIHKSPAEDLDAG